MADYPSFDDISRQIHGDEEYKAGSVPKPDYGTGAPATDFVPPRPVGSPDSAAPLSQPEQVAPKSTAPSFDDIYKQLHPDELKQPDVAAPIPPRPEETGVANRLLHSTMRGIFVGAPTETGELLQSLGMDKAGEAVKGLGQTAEQLEPKLRAITPATNPIQRVAESTLEGLGGMAPKVAAIAGATAVAGPVGTVAATAAMFGAPARKRGYDEAIAAGKSEGDAQVIGAVHGAVSTALWSLAPKMFEGFAKGLVEGGVKATEKTIADSSVRVIKQLMTPTWENAAKELGINVAGLTATGATEAAGLAAYDRAKGMPGESPWEAAKSTLGQSIATSILFFIGVRAAGNVERGKMLDALSDETAKPATRIEAAAQVALELEKVNPELAEVWSREAKRAIYPERSDPFAKQIEHGPVQPSSIPIVDTGASEWADFLGAGRAIEEFRMHEREGARNTAANILDLTKQRDAQVAKWNAEDLTAPVKPVVPETAAPVVDQKKDLFGEPDKTEPVKPEVKTESDTDTVLKLAKVARDTAETPSEPRAPGDSIDVLNESAAKTAPATPADNVKGEPIDVAKAQFQQLHADIMSNFGFTPDKAEGVVTLMKSIGMKPDSLSFNREETYADKAGDPQRLGERVLGTTQFLDNGKALITAYQQANFSTAVHEIAHVARRFFMNLNVDPVYRIGISTMDVQRAELWAGVGKDHVWTKDAEERFARGFERYIRDGKAPVPELQNVFSKMKSWMLRVYSILKGSDIDVQISPEMRNVFDKLVTRGMVERGEMAPLQPPAQGTLFQRAPDRITHYGKFEDTKELDPDAYGTGKPGAEFKRSKDYPDNWVNRWSAYRGDHTKEAGLGPHAYQISDNLNLLEHGSADSKKLWAEAAKKTAWPGVEAQFTAYEKLAKEAGYDGISGFGNDNNQVIGFKKQSVERLNGEPSTLKQTDRPEEVVPSEPRDETDRLAPVRESIQGFANAWDGLRKLFAPTSRNKESLYSGGNMDKYTAENVRSNFIYHERLDDMRKAIDLLTPAQRADFAQKYSIGDLAGMPHDLRKVAEVIRARTRAEWEEIERLAPGKLPFRENYWWGGWQDDVSPGSSQSHSFLPEGFFQPKKYQSYNEAIAAGKTPVSDNVIVSEGLGSLYRQRWIMMLKTLQDDVRYGNAVVVEHNNVPKGKPPGYSFIPEPYGNTKAGQYAVKDEVFPVYKNFFSQPLSSNPYFGQIYRGYMQAASLMNRVELLSLFHLGFMVAESDISKGALAMKQWHDVMTGRGNVMDALKSSVEVPFAFVTKAREGNTLMKEYSDPGSQGPDAAEAIRRLLDAGGQKGMDNMFNTSHMEALQKSWREGKYMTAVSQAPLAFMEKAMQPLMQWYIPRLKFGAFNELAEHFSKTHPEITGEAYQAKMRDIWSNIDERMGQVVYSRMHMNNAAKGIIQALVRAPGWTGGTIKQIGGSLGETVKYMTEFAKTGKLPSELPNRVAYTMALFVTAAVTNGALTALLTGEQPKDMDFLAFRTGALDANGDPERGMLPMYTKDVYAYKAAPGSTLLHKMNPLLSTIGAFLKNQDYYGTQITTPSAGYGQKIGEIGTYLGKAFTPFFVTGMQKNAEEGITPLRMAGPMVGVMPAPSYFNQTSAERTARQLTGEMMPVGGQDPGRSAAHQLINKYVKQYNVARQSNQPTDEVMASLSKDLQEGTLTKQDMMSFHQKLVKNSLVTLTNKLAMRDAFRVWDTATPEEQKKLAPIMFKKYRNMPAGKEKTSFLERIQQISNGLSGLYKE